MRNGLKQRRQSELTIWRLERSHQNWGEQVFRRYTLRNEQEAAITIYYRVIGEEPSN